MSKKLQNSKTTRERLGNISPMTFWRWIKSGKFPEPDARMNGHNYWLESTTDQYIEKVIESQAEDAA